MSAVWIALPIAVPPRDWIVSSESFTRPRSSVGGTRTWEMLVNVIKPRSTLLGVWSTKLFAALRAATRRVGLTSVACIDPDVSVTSITVALRLATSSVS